VAYDWRVMELAVALSKYVGEDDPLPLIREFVRCGGGGRSGPDGVMGESMCRFARFARPDSMTHTETCTKTADPRSGYAQNGRLTEAEIAAIPDCINLRIFSNVIYFTGRAVAGEDGLESLTSRAGSYAKRVKWVNANRAAIVDTIRGLVLAPAGARS
jgi:homoserine kinase type II